MRLQWPSLLSHAKFPRRALTIEASATINEWREALSHYHHTRKESPPANPSTIPAIFKACAALRSFNQGISIHADAIKLGFDSFTSTCNSAVSFYIKCGMTSSALTLFDSMENKDSVSWNAVIHGLLTDGDSKLGLGLFIKARVSGFTPNLATLVLALQACWMLEAKDEGFIVHGFIIRSGFSEVLSVQNSLLAFYAKSQDLSSAEDLFGEMAERDVISWSILISGYAQCEEPKTALRSFREMLLEGATDVDGLTVVGVLQGCSSLGDVNHGRSIHCHVILRGFESDTFVGNSLVDMYSKCLDVDSARLSFDLMPRTNVVSWNSLLSGLVHNEKYFDAFTLFYLMMESTVEIDEVTFVSLLQASKRLGHGILCKCIHSAIVRRILEPNISVLNSLLDAYAKCDLMGLARELFERMEKRNTVSWCTMIAGFTDNCEPDEAVAFFRAMILEEGKPDPVAMLSLFEASATSADLRLSKSAHGIAIRSHLASDPAVGTAVLDMYAKCGDISTSKKVFRVMPERNLLSWNAMMSALGNNGCAMEAVELLHEMESGNVKPNGVTMLSLMSACGHGGLLVEGLSCFRRVTSDPSLSPSIEHYSCAVDLLGRAGHLEGALGAIEGMPEGIEAGPAAWGALLSACRSRGDSELGRAAVSRVLELEPSNSAGYLMASSLYASKGSKDENARMRLLMRERRVRATSGYSAVRVDLRDHRFVAWDGAHPDCGEIYSMVDLVHGCMKEEEKDCLII